MNENCIDPTEYGKNISYRKYSFMHSFNTTLHYTYKTLLKRFEELSFEIKINIDFVRLLMNAKIIL